MTEPDKEIDDLANAVILKHGIKRVILSSPLGDLGVLAVQSGVPV